MYYAIFIVYLVLCSVRTCNKAAKEITAVPSKSSPPADLLQNWRTNGTLKKKLGIESFLSNHLGFEIPQNISHNWSTTLNFKHEHGIFVQYF